VSRNAIEFYTGINGKRWENIYYRQRDREKRDIEKKRRRDKETER